MLRQKALQCLERMFSTWNIHKHIAVIEKQTAWGCNLQVESKKNSPPIYGLFAPPVPNLLFLWWPPAARVGIGT